MRYLRYAGIVFAIALVMVIATKINFIPAFFLVGAIVVLGVLIGGFTKFDKRIMKLASGILLIIVLVLAFGPYLRDSLERQLPITAKILPRAQLGQDLQFANYINPVNLESRVQFVNYSVKMEKETNKAVQDNLKNNKLSEAIQVLKEANRKQEEIRTLIKGPKKEGIWTKIKSLFGGEEKKKKSIPKRITVPDYKIYQSQKNAYIFKMGLNEETDHWIRTPRGKITHCEVLYSKESKAELILRSGRIVRFWKGEKLLGDFDEDFKLRSLNNKTTVYLLVS